MTEDDRKSEVKELLRDIPEDERASLLRELEEDESEREGYPTLDWAHNPVSTKFALNFIASNGTVTFEELRQALYDNQYTKKERGEYSFGIVSTDDDDLMFNTNGGRHETTEIELTEMGDNIAGFLDDSEVIRPCERPLFAGLHLKGAGAVFLSALNNHRDNGGMLRQDVIDEMESQLGDEGKKETDYYASVFSKVDLIERNDDHIDGRRSRYLPKYPEN